MIRALSFFSAAILALSLSACGSSKISNSESNVSRHLSSRVVQKNSSTEYIYEYQYERDRCNTGTHEITAWSRASAVYSLCAALRDNELNHNCAEDLRREAFTENCPNQRW